jgi:hypothetical protein
VVRLDRAQREQVIEGEREIARGDEQRRENDVPPLARLQRRDHLGDLDVVQHAIEHNAGGRDDHQAEPEAHQVPADCPVDEPRGRAERMEHSVSLGSVSATFRFFFLPG